MKTLRELGIPTITAAQGQPGDAVFCHSKGLVGGAIRLGQWLSREGPYRKWNHIAWLDRPILDEGGVIVDWYIGQAIGHGVDNSKLLSTVDPGGYFEIVPLTAFPTEIDNLAIDRDLHLENLRSQIGDKYGFLTIASVVFTILTPRWIKLDFRRSGTWICSGLYSWGLHGGGGLVGADVYQIMPAEVAKSAA